MIEGGIFFTIKDLMQLTGTKNYSSAAKTHLNIREDIALGKRKITIREYCTHEKLDYAEIIRVLRPLHHE